MSDRNQFKRPPAVRTEPYRNPMHPRKSSAEKARRPQTNGRPADHGVDLGYQVIDEHLRRGHEAAQRARRGVREPSRMLFREASRLGLTDLLWMWIELLQRLPLGDLAPFRRRSSRARGGWAPFFEDELEEADRDDRWAEEEYAEEEWPEDDVSDEDMADPTWDPHKPRHAQRHEQYEDDDDADDVENDAQDVKYERAASPRVKAALQIASRRPVLVSLDLAPDAPRRSLAIHAFHCVDGGTQSLSDVDISVRADLVVFRLNITDEQQAGRYVGIVLDSDSKEAVGTVSVTITEG